MNWGGTENGEAKPSALGLLGESAAESRLVEKIRQLEWEAGKYREMRATLIVNAHLFGLNLDEDKRSGLMLLIEVLQKARDGKKEF